LNRGGTTRTFEIEFRVKHFFILLNSTSSNIYYDRNIPGVVGCVDDTNIPITRPSYNPKAEKKYFAVEKAFILVHITKLMTLCLVDPDQYMTVDF
jgi:hypothetical protein